MVDGIQGVSNVNVQMMAEMREKMFASLDSDGDGQINLADLQQTDKTDDRFTRMIEDLTAVDADGDGMVTREEFEQMPTPPPPPPPSDDSGQDLFELLDSDGDGVIDLTEIQSQADETGETDSRLTDLLDQLTAADSDGDGIITREEFDQMVLARASASELSDTGTQLYTRDSSSAGTIDTIGTLVDQLG